MNKPIAKQSQRHGAPHNAPARTGVPLDVALDIVNDILTVDEVEHTLGIPRSAAHHRISQIVWMPEEALCALNSFVHIVPTVFTRQELLGSKSLWEGFMLNEHFLFEGRPLTQAEMRYRVVLRDMPIDGRVKAWRIAREFDLKPKRLGLTAALTSTVIAMKAFDVTLEREYLTSSFSEDGRQLTLGPSRHPGRTTVRPVWPKECHREMIEFV